MRPETWSQLVTASSAPRTFQEDAEKLPLNSPSSAGLFSCPRDLYQAEGWDHQIKAPQPEQGTPEQALAPWRRKAKIWHKGWSGENSSRQKPGRHSRPARN